MIATYSILVYYTNYTTLLRFLNLFYYIFYFKYDFLQYDSYNSDNI